jgi:hypothetical protein
MKFSTQNLRVKEISGGKATTIVEVVDYLAYESSVLFNLQSSFSSLLFGRIVTNLVKQKVGATGFRVFRPH